MAGGEAVSPADPAGTAGWGRETWQPPNAVIPANQPAMILLHLITGVDFTGELPLIGESLR